MQFATIPEVRAHVLDTLQLRITDEQLKAEFDQWFNNDCRRFDNVVTVAALIVLARAKGESDNDAVNQLLTESFMSKIGGPCTYQRMQEPNDPLADDPDYY